MANALLDFVMSVVRDPDAAARFATDPDQALLDAHLTDVTSADVHALIPVVTESLASGAPAVPAAGMDAGNGGIADTGGNVWTSGAATAAFDAFGDHVPADVVHDIPDIHSVAGDVINDPAVAVQSGLDDVVHAGVPDVAVVDDLHFDQPMIDDAHVDDAPAVDDWNHPVADLHHLDVDASGFDVLD